MASLITSFYSRSAWQTVGMCLLPIAADQLVQRVFAKKLSTNKLEVASSVISTVTYLLLSLQLPQSFRLGAPLFYLAYKAAQFYLSRKTPPPASSTVSQAEQELPTTSSVTSSGSIGTEPKNESLKVNHECPLSQQHPSPTVVSATPETEQKNESTGPNHGNEGTSATALPAVNSASTQTAKSQPAAPPSEETPEQKAAEDRLTVEIKTEHQATLRFIEIIKPFTKSQIMSLQAQLNSNSTSADRQKKLKAKNIKVKIRFGDTHVFKMGKQQIESLNSKGYAVTEKTLFFWIDIADGKERFPTNFIPLTMLDGLKPNARGFSLCLTEKIYQWTLTFKGKQLARLKSFADTIRKCRKVEVIHTGIVQSSDLASASKIDSHGTFLDNDLAAMNRLSCYIVPFKN
ncbi:MAG TPA: hypothetical protein VFU89_08170 [Rhabdochlamydiaceae bacterium]|nr:hypothetical protein [Rhabdochlamydiaceae bacterium]